MSEERRKRQQEREQQAKPSLQKKILTAVLVVAAFGAAVYLGLRKRTSRLDSFAQCLSSKQAKMYGAFWCPHCLDQKEMFGSSFQYISYIECGIEGSRAIQPVCVQAGVKNFPTWQFSDGSRLEGTIPLQTLATKSACPLP
jgi:hypothetical protein